MRRPASTTFRNLDYPETSTRTRTRTPHPSGSRCLLDLPMEPPHVQKMLR